ncbi:MAG: Lrp/AsnC family transcriptional regulator [Candidatus Eremiobacteraeota bacterium]|nr:Lrp/AsnC family transcriptional regulator [Candidatus Eremiobacteraeota bacterium]
MEAGAEKPTKMMLEGELDELDLRLLGALQQNARSTYAELGSAIGLKPPAVHDRVKRLEHRGFIKGYSARVVARRLGIELVAFVSAYTTSEVDYDAFTAAIAALPEVSEIHSVAGEESFVLKVYTRSTRHLDDFLSRLKAIPGMGRTKTTVVLSTVYERTGLALNELVGPVAPPARLRAVP